MACGASGLGFLVRRSSPVGTQSARVGAIVRDLTPDGKVAGKGSCNRFFGTATLNGAALTLSQMGSTRMACAPAVNDQEAKYLKALEQSQRFAIEGSTLLIRYSGSDKPLRFVRAGQ